MEKEFQQLFWGTIVNPGEKVTLESPDDYYTIITGAVLAEYEESNADKSSTLHAKIRTIDIEKIDPEGSCEPGTLTQTNLAYLTPGKREQVKMNHVFSPLSQIELEVNGPHSIHISGKYIPIDTNGEEEEIPDLDDSDEDLNDEELEEKIKRKYMRSPKEDSKEDAKEDDE